MLARKNKMTEPLNRTGLLLNENRIRKMAEGLRKIAALPDILGRDHFHENKVKTDCRSEKNEFRLVLSESFMKPVRM